MAQETELGGYQLVGRLAVGGMAEVYQAKARPTTQKSPGEPDDVVLKRLLPAYRNDGAYVKAFVDEAKLTVRLRHSHIVRTYRCFKAGIDYLMVQELVAGRTLAFMQEAFVKAGSAMPLSASAYITSCLLKALDYIHRAKVGENGAPIVHRDVNPANILLSVGGDVKLTDFGVAEVEGVMRGTEGALRGTIAYMSPEAVLGQAVDHRADLFAAGVILWEMFANQRLFAGNSELEMMQRVRDARVPNVLKYNPEVPDYVAAVVRKALFADRALRFQSAAEFQKALEVGARRAGWPMTVDALKPLLGG
ncbi:MAG: putative serine/threonine protein kinase [Myxococcaceae bacterium]|nr:putative serine/threonine protein kinase [Myxococcaceae bacterium]